jgi:hypothetical protein
MNPTQQFNTLLQQGKITEDAPRLIFKGGEGFTATIYVDGISFTGIATTKKQAEQEACSRFLATTNAEVTSKKNSRQAFLKLGGSYELEVEQDSSNFSLTLKAYLPDKLPFVFTSKKEESGGIDSFIKDCLAKVLDDVNK